MSDQTLAVRGLVYAAVAELCLFVIVQLMPEVSFDLSYQILMLISGVLVYASTRSIQLSEGWRTGVFSGQGRKLLGAWMLHCGVLLLLGYLFQHSAHFSRQALLLWFIVTPVALFVTHGVAVAVVPRLFPRLLRRRTAVLVFANYTARQLAHNLHGSGRWDVLGFFDDRDLDRIGGEVVSTPYLGLARDVAEFVRARNIDVVFVVLPGDGGRRAVSVLDTLGDTTASVYFVPDFEVFDRLEARLRQVEGVPVLEIAETPFYGVDGLLKRLFDIGFAVAALLALAPLMAIVALAIKLDSPGPVLFRQTRYGLNGRPFPVYKFRSMLVADRSRDLIQVQRDDPRVTRIGRFLRRTSLDELPQFINVLKGDMSVVGPRPHSVAHNEHYRKEVKNYMTRHKVRPGLTGWAQIHGLRGETAQLERMEERIRYDLEYIRKWSLTLDIKVILRTVLMIFKDSNAY